MKTKLSIKPLVIALSLFGATAALADINIGVSVSATGPAASLGIAEKNTIKQDKLLKRHLNDMVQ